MLPNFLHIGAEKSGTTWLYSRLRRHPDIFMPDVKELHYFNSKNSNPKSSANNFETQDLDWYKEHFKEAEDENAIGEATPMYLCDPKAPARIHEAIPDIKLIACLRYSTDRAYSHYWMARGKGHTSMSFEEVVQSREARFIERGRYARQIERYLDYFACDQILILIHEEVFDAPSESLNKICSFLGVDDTFYRNQSWITKRVHPASTERSILLHRAIGTLATWMRAHEGFRQVLDWIKEVGIAKWVKQANKRERDYPEMADKSRRDLDGYYVPTIHRVEQILGRQVKKWRSRSTRDLTEPSLDAQVGEGAIHDSTSEEVTP